MGIAGAFVFIEPSPYEIVGVIAIFLFALTGLTLRPSLMPLALLLIFMNIGYAIAVLPVSDQQKPVIWVLVSIFLAGTTVFYAAMLGANTQARDRRADARLRGRRDHRFAGCHRRATSGCSAASRRCSCSISAPAAPSTIRTCSAPSWCCPGC